MQDPKRHSGWHMSVKDMSRGKTDLPVFQWNCEEEEQRAELQAFPLWGTLYLNLPHVSHRFTSVKGARAKIREYGWGNPPHLQKVFNGIHKSHEKLRVTGVQNDETPEEIFFDLKKKWEALIASESSSD